MKKDKKEKTSIDNEQAWKEIKKDMPVKNAVTDSVKNTASQTPGIKQGATTRDDVFPSDGDNMTS